MHAWRHPPTVFLLARHPALLPIVRRYRSSIGTVGFLIFLLAIAGCGRAADPGTSALNIVLVPGKAPADAFVRVTGFSAGELRALRDAQLAEPAWQALMRVTVTDNEVGPVAGRFLVTPGAVEFHPRFGLDPGRSYSVRVDPRRLPRPRTEAAIEVRLRPDGPAPTVSTSVTAIYPSAAIWPENMLRFYVHFSGPMSRGAGTKYVHLVDDGGHEVADAILAAYADLWNPDATRLTVFFDPGRVKRGVGPNVALGRAITHGRRYAITVDRAWPDAAGRPLSAGFRRDFTAGAAAYDELSTDQWRIATPPAGSRSTLTVRFPAPLDHALLERAIGVRSATGRDVAGRITLEAEDTTWALTPDVAWRAGHYELVVLTLLEDPAGNKIGRAFEVLPADSPDTTAAPDVVQVPFEIK
jgi:hypothetical protein